MRKVLMVAVMLLAGCRGIQGPMQRAGGDRVDDPRVPIREQQRLGRERLALPVETNDVGPRSGNAYPGLPNMR